MKVIGLDSGLASFGWVIAEYADWTGGEGLRPKFIDGGVFSTKPNKDLRKGLDASRRAVHLFGSLEGVMRRHSGIVCIAVEALAFPVGRVQWSVISGLGRARGLVDALSVVLGVPLYEATPVELKKALLDRSSGEKAEMIERLQMHHPEVERLLGEVKAGQREHLADACAAVIACQRFNFEYLKTRWLAQGAAEMGALS